MTTSTKALTGVALVALTALRFTDTIPADAGVTGVIAGLAVVTAFFGGSVTAAVDKARDVVDTVVTAAARLVETAEETVSGK